MNHRVAAGEVASTNYYELQKVQRTITELAKASVVDANMQAMRIENNANIEKIYNWASPMDFSVKLQQTQVIDVRMYVYIDTQMYACMYMYILNHTYNEIIP